MKDHYKIVKTKLVNQGFISRYIHTLGVIEEAKNLAALYKQDLEDAEIAALFHDFFRHDSFDDIKKYLTNNEIFKYKNQPIIYHAIAASRYVEKHLKPTNKDIILAIRNHVWGRPNMTTLEKILIIADESEINREFEMAATIREIAKTDLNKALMMTLKNSIEHVLSTNQTLNEEQILTYNYYYTEEK